MMLYILLHRFFLQNRYSRDVGFFRMLLSSTSVPLGAIFASGMICVFCLMRYDMISNQRRREGNKRSPLDCVSDRKCVRWTAQETGLHVSDGK